MFTRAYDAIMAATFTPMLRNNSDYSPTIADNVCNCKNIDGYVRNVAICDVPTSNTLSELDYSYRGIPFLTWQTPYRSQINGTQMLVDLSNVSPSYEDYEASLSAPSNISYKTTLFDKEYDEQTKEFVNKVSYVFLNTGAENLTAYGLKCVSGAQYMTRETGGMTSSWQYFLLYREHFAEPLIVPPNELFKLTFTYRVGRQGITVDGASAE